MIILVINIVFLFPLAIYCLILARLNRKRHPVMISGAWDFAGVLFAVSGFLLVGGPAILWGFYHRWLDLWLTHAAYRAKSLDEKHAYWLSLWAAYFVLVLTVSALVLWLRRWQTSIYNVQPDEGDQALAGALDRLGLTWYRSANRFVVTPAPSWNEEADISEEGGLVIQMEPFLGLRHLSLRWSTDGGILREKIEKELAAMLQRFHTRDNPAAVWLLSFGTGILALMVFDILLLVYRLYQEVML